MPPKAAGAASTGRPAAQKQAHTGTMSAHPLVPTGTQSTVARKSSAPSPAKDKENDPETSNAVPTPAPAWSELKTKAGKERKRLPLACKSCRRKKVRCSGETPSCKHCLRARIPCVYKVTQRKATPRTDYMNMLDKRLKRMEERVIKLIPPADANRVHAIGRASVKPPGADKSKNQSKKRPAFEAFAQDPEDSLKANIPSHKDLSETSSLMEGVEYLPSAELQEHLAEAYFDFCYGQPYHLLHKPSFMRRLRAGTIPPVLMLALCAISSRFSAHPSLAAELPSVRGEQWAQEARKIASRSFGEPNMTVVIVLTLLALYDFGSCQGGRAWMYAGIAMRMCYALQLNQEHGDEVAGSDEQGPKSRPGRPDISGKASTAELSFTDQEIRRRTMWSCCLMDVFNSSGTKRPSFDHIPNLNIQLPIKEEYFQNEVPGRTEDVNAQPGHSRIPEDLTYGKTPRENMGVAAYLIKILVLWGQVVHYTNSGRMDSDTRPLWHPDSEFTKLKQRVQAFARELPQCLRYTKENVRNHHAEKLVSQFAFMHIVFHQVNLFLHKFTIPAFPGVKLPSSMPNGFRDEAMKSAISSATNISKILDDSKDLYMTAPFASYCTFASSTVHIWAVFSGFPQLAEASKAHLACNMRYLFKMKKYWSMIHYMTESLRDIYRQHADAHKNGIANGTNVADEPFFEYGDMQDREHPPAVVDEDGCKHSQSPRSKSKTYASLGSKSDLQSVGDWFQATSQSPQPASSDIPSRPAKSRKQQHGPPTTSVPKPQQLEAVRSGPGLTQTDSTGTFVPQIGMPNNNQLYPKTSQPQFGPVSNPYQGANMAAAFSPGGSSNPYFGRLPMQAFDRQLVYGAYAHDPMMPFGNFDFDGGDGGDDGGGGASAGAGGDFSALNSLSTAAGGGGSGGSGAIDPGMAAQFGVDPSGPPNGMSASGAEFGDASAAWLTPFHLVPPINLVQPQYAAVAAAPSDGLGFGHSEDNNMVGGMEFWNT